MPFKYLIFCAISSDSSWRRTCCVLCLLVTILNVTLKNPYSLRCDTYWFWSSSGKNEHEESLNFWFKAGRVFALYLFFSKARDFADKFYNFWILSTIIFIQIVMNCISRAGFRTLCPCDAPDLLSEDPKTERLYQDVGRYLKKMDDWLNIQKVRDPTYASEASPHPRV